MKKIIFILFISSPCFASCQIADVLPILRPGAAWNLRGTIYSGIEWLDVVQSSPSISEVQQGITTCQNNALTLQVEVQNDIFNIRLSTNIAATKLQYLIDLLQVRQQLQ